VLGNATALPTAGNITVAGGTFDLNNQGPSYTGSVSLAGGTLANGPITKNNGNFDFQSGTVASTAVLTGSAGVVKTGTGTLVLTGNHS
jgi:hypothetical protein